MPALEIEPITADPPPGRGEETPKAVGPEKPLTFWLSKMIQRSASRRFVFAVGRNLPDRSACDRSGSRPDWHGAIGVSPRVYQAPSPRPFRLMLVRYCRVRCSRLEARSRLQLACQCRPRSVQHQAPQR